MPEKSTKESLAVSIILIVMAIVILIDIVNDVAAGGSLLHVALEIFIMGLALAALTWTWSSIVRQLRERIEVSQERLKELEDEASRWREQISNIKPNLEEAVSQQLSSWKLTQAEQEITRLILKGFTNKEIAEIRSSSESTIKQQTTSIYRKTGLTSRSQLAAFFLEDLF